MFPKEILRIISLKLPSLTLALNHDLQSIYDDGWYEDYLKLQCPHTKLWKHISYRNCYAKFRQSGEISKYTMGRIYHYLGWGTTAADLDGKTMILNFNGELYIDLKRLANRVVAIDSYTFIKEFEWYYHLGNEWHKLKITPSSPFISVKYTPHHIFASTEKEVYFYDHLSNFHYPVRDHPIRDRSVNQLPDSKEIKIKSPIYMLDNQGTIYRITDSLTGRGPPAMTQVKNLYGSGLEMQDGSYKLYYRDYEKLVMKTIPLSGKFSNILEHMHELFLLQGDNLYHGFVKSISGKCILGTDPLFGKIKRMIYDLTGVYFIWEDDGEYPEVATFCLPKGKTVVF